MSEEAKRENRELLRAALGVSKLEERKKDELTPEEARKAKFKKLIAELPIKPRFDPNVMIKDLLIYNSKTGSSEINLNGQAVDDKGEKITCRQLSYEVALLRMRGYSEKLSSIENIQQQDSLKKNKYDNEKIQNNSAYYNLFHLNSLGDTLQSIAQVLDKGEECSVLFLSLNHLMTISIWHKMHDIYVIKFFDPNKTTMHRRALCANLRAIPQLVIEDFLTDDLIDKYFPNFRSGIIFSKTQRSSSDHAVFVIDDAASQGSKIHSFLEYGWSGNEKHHLKNILQEVLESKLTPDEKIKILTAKTDLNYSGLCTALFRGYVDTVKVYVQTIIDSDKLSDLDKIKLFTTCVGLEKLIYALCNFKAAAAAAAYKDIVSSSKLPLLVKLQILQLPIKKELEENKSTFFNQKNSGGEVISGPEKTRDMQMVPVSLHEAPIAKPIETPTAH